MDSEVEGELIVEQSRSYYLSRIHHPFVQARWDSLLERIDGRIRLQRSDYLVPGPYSARLIAEQSKPGRDDQAYSVPGA